MIVKFEKQLVSGILALSLLTTSFGGAFAASAYAAAPETLAAEEVKDDSKKDILAGLAAIGLIAMLSNGGSDSSSKGSSSGKTTTPPPSSGSSNSGPTGSVSASEEQQAVNLLNQDRAKYGLPALKVNSQLTSVARKHAQDMISRGYFAHNTPEGVTPFQRLQKAGISYRTAGENLAINRSVAGAEQAFMTSSGHRANILNSSYTEVGIGVVRNSSGSVYVVQEFIGK